MYGQRIINVTCHVCGEKMPDLVDDGSWGISECSCDNWYDVPNARTKGRGKLIG